MGTGYCQREKQENVQPLLVKRARVCFGCRLRCEQTRQTYEDFLNEANLTNSSLCMELAYILHCFSCDHHRDLS